jgi:DNA-binding transcriptional ArsR family regulator
MERDFIGRQVADIDRRLQEIDEALSGWNDLVHQRERLQAARAALTGQESANQGAGDGKSRPRRAQRARRGENKRRVLETVRERPGASIGELAQASGVARPTAYNTLRQLLEGGEVERVDLGGGQIGYRAVEGDRSPEAKLARG